MQYSTYDALFTKRSDRLKHKFQAHTTIKLQRQKFKYFYHKVARQNSLKWY